MKYLLNGTQMKQIDAISISQYGVPSLVLMERAALAVATRMKQVISKDDRILVLSTSGNNGADGLAVARIMYTWGYQVEILACGSFDHATDENNLQLHMVQKLGISVINNAKISTYNIIVDALFGIGLNKPITGELVSLVNEVNHCDNVVFSVDIPSGIHAGSGQILGCCIQADYTITFGYEKLGLVLHPGCEYAGKIYCDEIGFVPGVIDKVAPTTFTYEQSDLEKVPRRHAHSNKGTYGKVLVIAGSKNMSGACYLSAKAAYRTGAGLVKILTAKDNRTILQASLPEAILATYEADTGMEELVKHLDWATVIVIGPGIGDSKEAAKLLDLVVTQAKVPVVMDADALNLLAAREDLEELLTGFSNRVILTPHLMEMSRLAKVSVQDIKNELLPFAVDTVKGKQYTLVLKDARTIVARDSQEYINCSGNHGMATAGAGDVLTGIIAGILAEGMPPYEAACLGVYIHGLAGDKAREKKGAYSLMAEDIVESISDVLKVVDNK